MSSPSSKRIKLEAPSSPSFEPEVRDDLDIEAVEDPNVEQCSICLQPMADRALIPSCSHEFCFECLHVWTDQSRRCPLCSQGIGDYLIHHIRSKYDFQKHYLTPLRKSPNSQPLLPVASGSRGRISGSHREVQWGRTGRRARQRERDAADALENAIDKRRWVYRHGLYAKHVASNFYTRYRPFPTPSQFATNPDLITRATIFIRRELHVWGCLDVEFLTTFIISLLKSLDIRSESAIKLLSEFLDLDSEHELQVRSNNKRPRANAEHFAHELYCYLRSPYRDLSVYDTVVQYDIPEDYSPRPTKRSRRWRSRSTSSTRQQPPSRSRSQSPSKTQPGLSESTNRQTSSRHKQARRGRVSPSGSVSPRDERHRYSSPEPHLAKQAGESGRDEAGEDTISRDRKGKGRAVHDSDVFESSEHRREVLTIRETGASDVIQGSASRIEQKPMGNETSFPSQTTEGECISASTDASLVSISRRPRTVFDQLQSHLSKATDSKKASILQRHELPIGNERPGRRLDESFQYPVATKSSLLDRLSGSLAPIESRESGGSRDPSHDQDGVDRINTPDHMEIIHGSRATTTPALSKVVHASGQATKTTRETMLQWLNVANQSGNRDLKPKQRFNGIDGVSATVKSPTLTSPSSSSSPSTTSASSLQQSADSTESSSSILRARLLTKLENERRVREDTVSAPAAQVTNNGAAPPHADDKIDSSNSSSSHSDTVLEAKLRSQALLRARLAVEKSKIVDPGNLSCADQDEGKRPSLESSERELRLKIQLRKARG